MRQVSPNACPAIGVVYYLSLYNIHNPLQIQTVLKLTSSRTNILEKPAMQKYWSSMHAGDTVLGRLKYLTPYCYFMFKHAQYSNERVRVSKSSELQYVYPIIRHYLLLSGMSVIYDSTLISKINQKI